MSKDKDRLHGAVIRKMGIQLAGVIEEVRHRDDISISLKAQTIADMTAQLEALEFAADVLMTMYGVPPEIIEVKVNA